MSTRTVPLVAYHDDRRVVIGEATVDDDGLVKAHVTDQVDVEALSEVVATVFKFDNLGGGS